MENILNFLAYKNEVQKVSILNDTIVCELNDECENLVVLTRGRIKVFRTSKDGRHMTLYQICSGEACVLTASCLLNEKMFPAIAIAVEPSEGYVVPKKILVYWLKTEIKWQEFIFNLLSQRMGDLIEKVDQLAFKTLEERLMQWLSGHQHTPNLKVTHQQIAEELASSREVISRALKKLEEKEFVKLQRGQIVLLNKILFM